MGMNDVGLPRIRQATHCSAEDRISKRRRILSCPIVEYAACDLALLGHVPLRPDRAADQGAPYRLLWQFRARH